MPGESHCAGARQYRRPVNVDDRGGAVKLPERDGAVNQTSGVPTLSTLRAYVAIAAHVTAPIVTLTVAA